MGQGIVVPPHGVTLKVLRAQWQLDEIKAFLSRFTQDHVDGVMPQGDLDGHILTLRLPDTVEQSDEQTGILIGEYVHNLRSALDHLTYALLESNLPSLGVGLDDATRLRRQSQFPICDTPDQFRDRRN